MKKKAEEARTVLKNVAEFLDAVALTVVAVYAIVVGVTHRNDNNWYYSLLAAGLLVAYTAFLLLIKHFSKK